MYVNKRMSSTEIAKIFGCTHRTILLRLNKMGVNRRMNSDSVFNYNNKERPKELDSYDFMYDAYVNKSLPKSSIAKILDVSPNCVDRALRKLNIHVRDSSESKVGRRNGKDSPRWNGGVTSLSSLLREYYQINISPKIRERDEYRCQLCGAKSNLHTHHIVPFSKIIKEICSEHPELDIEKDKEKLYNIIIRDERFNDENNLITYCKNCHLFIIHKYKKSISSQALKQ